MRDTIIFWVKLVPTIAVFAYLGIAFLSLLWEYRDTQERDVPFHESDLKIAMAGIATALIIAVAFFGWIWS